MYRQYGNVPLIQWWWWLYFNSNLHKTNTNYHISKVLFISFSFFFYYYRKVYNRYFSLIFWWYILFGICFACWSNLQSNFFYIYYKKKQTNNMIRPQKIFKCSLSLKCIFDASACYFDFDLILIAHYYTFFIDNFFLVILDIDC